MAERAYIAHCTADQAHLLRPHVERFQSAHEALVRAVGAVFGREMALPGAEFDPVCMAVHVPVRDDDTDTKGAGS